MLKSKKRVHKADHNNDQLNKRAESIANKLLCVQNKWVEIMKNLTGGLSKKKLLSILILIGLMSIGWNLKLILVHNKVALAKSKPSQIKSRKESGFASDSLRLMEKVYKSYKKR